jgi:hypothetical protein
MFDITPEDINELSDVDLRELVGRLCEAELATRGLSPAAVTWGGNQTAADGGLDVRVALPAGTAIDGFIPRVTTGFQVKKPDMPGNAIIKEMLPNGLIRPVIQQLAQERGAYIIVSSAGSTADGPYQNRKAAMRKALAETTNGFDLETDFFDRSRLATWVRKHTGLIAWVRHKAGRSLAGWRSYGAWTGGLEDVDASYLLDEKLTLHFGRSGNTPAQSAHAGIEQLRTELVKPRSVVRLVGLSGVGKTRLVQALFDPRIGTRCLPPSLAVYTNLSDDPDPQPIGLATDLIANRRSAVLIVDNCPPDLHRRLSETCRAPASTISVITVEYDVRDDQPEGTQVATLDTSSLPLIQKLIQRRYPHVSQVDATTIADASGGNARIAVALAETVGASDTLADLTNEELFERLFRQRQESDKALFRSAQACSLLYSFDGETLEGPTAELPRLASLAGQLTADIYMHISELQRRELVQSRSVWRAVLPHAIANRLAGRTLEDIPFTLIDQQLVQGGTERTAKSFSRRLTFLHDHPRAIAIVRDWLAPLGRLGNVAKFDAVQDAMFKNIAPVIPEATLVALERVGITSRDTADSVWHTHRSLLRSLAYDPILFDRSARMLAHAMMKSARETELNAESAYFTSLFSIYLSGTHASIEIRLAVIEELLRSLNSRSQALGLEALKTALRTSYFSSHYRFEFGARSRDYGYHPRTSVEIKAWYATAVRFIEKLALDEGMLANELREILTQSFPGLWASAGIRSELDSIFRRFATTTFWPGGWIACRKAMQLLNEETGAPDALLLSALEATLRPSNLRNRIQAMVLGNAGHALDPDNLDSGNDLTNTLEKLEDVARSLGEAAAIEVTALRDLLPDLLRGGNRVWAFGQGLARAAPDKRGTWELLVQQLEYILKDRRDIQILRAFLSEVWTADETLAQDLLDGASDHPILQPFLPLLHSAVTLDERGVARMENALYQNQIPIQAFRNLAYGKTTHRLSAQSLHNLLLKISDKPEGFSVALEILHMRLFSSGPDHRQHEPEILAVGQMLLRRVSFCGDHQRDDYQRAEVAKACLVGPHAEPIAAAVASSLKQAITDGKTYAFDNNNLLTALLEKHPVAVLDALFKGNQQDREDGVRVFDHIGEHCAQSLDVVSCETLIAWCDVDKIMRYPLLAHLVTLAQRSGPPGSQTWSEQSKALLANAPDPEQVLATFIDRFRPCSWSGSRAALMEANGQLLESIDMLIPQSAHAFAMNAKAQFAEVVARERMAEDANDRGRDERFE